MGSERRETADFGDLFCRGDIELSLLLDVKKSEKICSNCIKIVSGIGLRRMIGYKSGCMLETLVKINLLVYSFVTSENG